MPSAAKRGYSYAVSYAPSGRATCKECKKAIAQGSLRISRSFPNPFDAGTTDYTSHYHPAHAFQVMMKSKCESKVVLRSNTLRGFGALPEADKTKVKKQIAEFKKAWEAKCK
jgi:hypothetical protein